MKEKQKFESNLTSRAPKLLQRIAKGLGSRSMDRPITEEARPEVRPFDPRQQDIIDYVRRNAALADMDKEGGSSSWVIDQARRLQEMYGKVPSDKKVPAPDAYGFSEETAMSVFQWNKNETSERLAEDLLYCLGSEALGDPVEMVCEDGAIRVTQTYDTSTGLRLIDSRTTYEGADEQRKGYHDLQVFLPQHEDQSQAA
jgi:hypothetical protein